MWRSSLVWALAIVSALLPAVTGAKSVKTVFVDCAKGQSIANALEQKVDELIVEISGICEEDVVVRRSDVTLRGSDPLVDGIRPGPDESLDQALNVRGTHSVLVENLSLSGGRVGMGINDSFSVDIVNCRLEGNEAVGLILGTGSGSNDLIDSVVTGNGGSGIFLGTGTNLRCTGCTVTGNGTFNGAAVVRQGAELELYDSTLDGYRGVDLRGGSRLYSGGGSTIRGGSWAVRGRGTVSIELRGAVLDGAIELQQGSSMSLRNTTQTVTTGFQNRIWSGSELVVEDPATGLAGGYQIRSLGRLSLPAGATVDGSLVCGLGADAYCDDPIGSVGGTSDCGSCFKP